MGGSMWLQMRLSPQATGNSEAEKFKEPCLNFSINTYHYISWFCERLGSLLDGDKPTYDFATVVLK